MSTRLAGVVLFLAWLALGSLAAADPPAQLKLIGLVNSVDGKPRAWLEVGGGESRRAPEFMSLGEGERQGIVEVRHIDVANAQVQLWMPWGGVTLHLEKWTSIITQASAPEPASAPIPADHPPSLSLRQANLGMILKLYGEFAGRTVLQHPGLPVVSISLDALPANRADTVRILESLLATNGIATLPDGEHFILVVPKAAVATETLLAKAPQAGPAGTFGTLPKIRAGDINFPGTNWRQVFQIYGELRGRSVIQTEASLPGGEIVMLSQTPLTREEIAYALETHFRWHNVVIEEIGDHAIKAVAAGKAK